jgi:hypothetical protein
MKYSLSILLFVFLTAAGSLAKEMPAPVKAVSMVKCAAPPVIDGVLQETEWLGAKKLELKFQVMPGDNSPPSERTEIFLTYDTQHLYLAFHAYDSNPSTIRANGKAR